MRTLIVSSSPKDVVVGKLKRLLGDLDGFAEPCVASFDEADRVAPDKADLVIVNLCGNPGLGQDVIRRLHERGRDPLLAVGEVHDPKLILRSLQMGAALFLDEAELEAEFRAAMGRLFEGTDVVEAVGKLVAVLSASGGCGASTLAVNLAALRAREYGTCALLDLNLGHGDLPALLDLKPQFTLADVCRNLSRLDQAMLGKMLVRHSSGVHLLASPREFADMTAVTAAGVKSVLSLVRRLFPETIVDLENCCHDEQTAVLSQATTVLVVCRLEFTALHNTRRILDHLHKLDVPRARVKLVANHCGQAAALPVDEAEGALGGRFAAFIPHDPKAIGTGNNAGIPAVLGEPGSKAVKAILELANIHSVEKSPSSIVRSVQHLLREVFHARH